MRIRSLVDGEALVATSGGAWVAEGESEIDASFYEDISATDTAIVHGESYSGTLAASLQPWSAEGEAETVALEVTFDCTDFELLEDEYCD